MEFRTSIITAQGHALMAKLLNNQGTAKFTRVVTSDVVYKDEQLEALTAISSIKQSVLVSNVTVTNESTVTVEGVFENTKLTQGYSVNTIGLYAQDPTAGEILYSVTPASQNAYMPAFNSVTSSGLLCKLITVVSNSAQVDLTIDPAATMTREDVDELIGELQMETVARKADLTNGENLIPNSDFSNGTAGWFMHYGDGATVQPETLDGQSVLHVAIPAGAGGLYGISLDLSSVVLAGDNWILQVCSKGTAKLQYWGIEQSSVATTSTQNLTEAWQIFTKAGVASGRGAFTVYFAGLSDIPTDAFLQWVKLERGNIRTPRSLMPVSTVNGGAPDVHGDVDLSYLADKTMANDFVTAPTVNKVPLALMKGNLPTGDIVSNTQDLNNFFENAFHRIDGGTKNAPFLGQGCVICFGYGAGDGSKRSAQIAIPDRVQSASVLRMYYRSVSYTALADNNGNITKSWSDWVAVATTTELDNFVTLEKYTELEERVAKLEPASDQGGTTE